MTIAEVNIYSFSVGVCRLVILVHVLLDIVGKVLQFLHIIHRVGLSGADSEGTQFSDPPVDAFHLFLERVLGHFRSLSFQIALK